MKIYIFSKIIGVSIEKPSFKWLHGTYATVYYKWFQFWAWLLSKHYPFYFLHFFVYVNLCAHFETQWLQLECLHLWQAGYSLTGSLHTSQGSIEMVAFCIGRLLVQSVVNKILCLVPPNPCECGQDQWDLTDLSPFCFKAKVYCQLF